MTPSGKCEDEAAVWLARLDAAGCLEKDGQPAWDIERLCGQDPEFAKWVAGGLEKRIAFLRMARAWLDIQRVAAFSSELNDVKPTRSPRIPSRWILAMAACLAFMALGSAGIITLRSSPNPMLVSTDIGEMRQLLLPDESVMQVNTNSDIEYIIDQKRRNVRINSGEAFFDVKKNQDLPFIVDSGGVSILVTGTSFSVSKLDRAIEVLVSEGSVRVTHGKQSVLLQHGDRAVTLDSYLLVDRLDDKQLAHQLAWRQGRLFFNDTPIRDAVAEFNRYNKVQLRIKDDEVGDVRIGGSFRANNVRSFAEVLEHAFGYTVQEGVGEILIRSN
ncbi:MAG: hypothetical protein CME88_03405 [Hirschia sp.]|nr:hypothetical protein [Hirschia sp.]MBF17405.1 hypothetical protein [Hirschia sp.]